jgi:hypothetical protein
MSATIDKVRELKEQMRQLREELAQKAKDGFHESIQELFENHPSLIQFSWTQYTPYFNDGDTCYFSAHTDYFNLQTAEDEEEEFSNYSLYDGYGKDRVEKEMTPHLEAGKAILEVLAVFDSEDYEKMFGDHCRVVVTREGVETEHYEHD